MAKVNNEQFFQRFIAKPFEIKPQQDLQNQVSDADKTLIREQNNLLGNLRRLNMLNQIGQVPQEVSPAEPKPNDVKQAVKTIQDSLNQSFTDWDVTHGDLENIQKTFEKLGQADANQAFKQLSDDDVKTLVGELSGTNGGYSVEEKQKFFNDLAKKLDAESLNRLAQAMDLGESSNSVRPGQRDVPDVNILAQSIAQNAPAGVKAEFVLLLAKNLDKHQNAGMAAAQVLASMKDNPQLLEQTLSKLSDSELQSVVDGAARKTEVSSRAGTVINYDPEPLGELLDAVSHLNGEKSAEQKARIFESSANKMTEIRENATRFGMYYGEGAEDILRNNLTKVIDSDTTGVVKSLKENFVDGNGITSYLKSLVVKGDNAQIAEVIAKLSKGNDLGVDAYQRFGQKSVDDDSSKTEILSNAQILGYFGGGLLAATRQVSGDYAKQAEMLKNIFGTVTGMGGPLESVINGLSTNAVNDVTKQLSQGKIKDAEAMQKLLIPRETDGKLYRGETEKGEFINWGDHVIVSNP